MSKVLVYGSKDFGSLVRNLVLKCGHDFVGFIDDFAEGENILGSYRSAKIIYSPDTYHISVAVGYKYLSERLAIYKKICSDGYKVETLIHPAAYIGESVDIGTGSIIMAGSIIDMNVTLQEMVVVWPGAVVSHDSSICKNSFISPNSTICGFAEVGANCFIGAGAVIADHATVPAGSFIKAGSVYK